MDELDIIEEKDRALKEVVQKIVGKINWSDLISYGSVKFQIRDGKATLTTIEHTIKLD